MSSRERKPHECEHAKFFEFREKLWVLKLSGSHHDRGYAHGKLLAAQILDFFEFFTLEFVLKSKSRFLQVRPHHVDNVGLAQPNACAFHKIQLMTKVVKPDWYKAELEGIMAGMKESGVSLYVDRLGRDFDIEDLHFVNTFVEVRTSNEVKPSEVSCTQFSFWGDVTKGL